MQQQLLKKVQPLLGRVLVQKLVPPKKTGNGILLPDSKLTTNIGKIVAVGSGKVLEVFQKHGVPIDELVKKNCDVLLPNIV